MVFPGLSLYNDVGAKVPNDDTCGLLRAAHSHNPPQGLTPTYEQAHVCVNLLTLVSYKSCIVDTDKNSCPGPDIL